MYHRPGQDTITGKEELREFYERDRPLEDGSHSVYTVIVEGKVAAVQGRFTGIQDGKTVDFGFADFHEFNDKGKIFQRYTYTDRDEV